jgi:hypothetical protein
MFNEALADLAAWRKIDSSPWTWAMEAYVHGRAGRPAEAQRAFTEFEATSRGQSTDPTAPLIVAYAGMNETEKALACLQQAHANRSNALLALKVDPIYDRLRGDSRFGTPFNRAV